MKNDQFLLKKHGNYTFNKLNTIKNHFLFHIFKKYKKYICAMIRTVHSKCFRVLKSTLIPSTKIYSFDPKVTKSTIIPVGILCVT